MKIEKTLQKVKEELSRLLNHFPQLEGNINEILYMYWYAYDGVKELEQIHLATPAVIVIKSLEELGCEI